MPETDVLAVVNELARVVGELLERLERAVTRLEAIADRENRR